jgi:hypothetical protein
LIGTLELFRGDLKSMRRAFRWMQQEQPLGIREKVFLLRSLLAQLGVWHDSGRSRRRYRCRRDWEDLFASLLDVEKKLLPLAAFDGSYGSLSATQV